MGSRSCSNPNPNPNPSPNPNLSLKLSLAYTHHPYHLSILTFYAFISQELLYGLFCPCCDTAWSKRPLGSALPQLLCLLGARLVALGSDQHSQEEAGPLDTQPLPRVLKLAASKVADFTAFDHSGDTIICEAIDHRAQKKARAAAAANGALGLEMQRP